MNGLKRIGYTQWLLEGPARAVIIRRNGDRYQVFDQGAPMVAGFFHETFTRKYLAVDYAEDRAGIP